MVYRVVDDQDEGDVHGGTRVCRRCSERKPMFEFHWAASKVHRTRTCKGCMHARQTEIRAGRREEQSATDRTHHLRREYGLTPEEVAAMRSAQGDGCAICAKPFGEGSGDRMHVDHCHVTGHVRALLCHNCNLGLGHFGDDDELMVKAIAYIQGHRERTAELGPPPGRKLSRAERQANRIAAALRQHRSEEGAAALRERSATYRGNRNSAARLTEPEVLAIRAAHAAGGVSQRQLAEKYGVSASHIGYIVKRKVWTHV